METPANVPLAWNHDLAYCSLFYLLFYISLQSWRKYIITHKDFLLLVTGGHYSPLSALPSSIMLNFYQFSFIFRH